VGEYGAKDLEVSFSWSFWRLGDLRRGFK
jgi:hypothetical protein